MIETTTATVFVVDDDDAIRDSLSLLAIAEGFAAESFPSAERFLGSFDPARSGCVVADIRMPGMSGLEMLRALRADGVDVPVIFITGHGDVPLAVSALKASAADFFEKPFDDVQLLASVRRALEREEARLGNLTAVAELRARANLLTARQREVMDLIVEGHPNKVIAARLSISPRTVEIHRARVMDKMKAARLSDLIRMSFRLNAG
jgi:two-component system response regulator FixJ